MAFDFDPEKSTTNKAKHGIDFAEAQALWNDPDRLEVQAGSKVELRSIVIKRIDEPIAAFECITIICRVAPFWKGPPPSRVSHR